MAASYSAEALSVPALGAGSYGRIDSMPYVLDVEARLKLAVAWRVSRSNQARGHLHNKPTLYH